MATGAPGWKAREMTVQGAVTGTAAPSTVAVAPASTHHGGTRKASEKGAAAAAPPSPPAATLTEAATASASVEKVDTTESATSVPAAGLHCALLESYSATYSVGSGASAPGADAK